MISSYYSQLFLKAHLCKMDKLLNQTPRVGPYLFLLLFVDTF